MAKDQKKLRRGLDSIFNASIDDVLNEIDSNSSAYKGDTTKIKVSEIRPNPYQPRKHFNEEGLKELADSIKEHGVFNPILVRKSSVSGYELIAGERRLRACKLAKVDKIPAIIVNFDDKGMMEVSILENIQRENLSPLEEAKAYEQLINKLKYTQDALAKRVSKSRAYITNTLRLLKLPSKVQDLLNKGKISYGHARALINIESEDKMIDLANRVVKDGLTVRDIERLAKDNKKPSSNNKPKTKVDPYLTDVRRMLENKLNTEVEVKNDKIVIHYSSVKKLNIILDKLDCLDK